ncbi:MAG: DUF2057 family protein [Gammaproteobacteria bacterium]
MKLTKTLSILFGVSWLQACNSVSGPVHFYTGQPRSGNDTARLKVPAAITVTKIDGKEVKVPSKEEGFYEVFLLPGLHRIDFKYELSWGDNVSGMLIHSDVVGVETRLYAGKTYDLVYRVPADMEEAYDIAAASEFKARLVEQGTGRQVMSRSVSELDEFRLTAANEQGNTDITPQVVAPVTAEKPARISAPKGIDAETAAREDAVKRLKFWWLMANEIERQQFRDWMKSVDAIK